jgi:hypothetical protein
LRLIWQDLVAVENSTDNERRSPTQISGDYVNTAAEIRLSITLQAAELFVDHSRELALPSAVPIEPTISDLLEPVYMLATRGHFEVEDSCWYEASNFCCFEESGTVPCNARPKREGRPRRAAVGSLAGG